MLSRRWAGLLQGPGPAWAEVTIDTDRGIGVSDYRQPNGMVITAWFSRRAGSVRTVQLYGIYIKLPASVVTAALESQATTLRQLALNLDTTQLSSADLAILVELTGLESLTLYLPEGETQYGNDHAAAAIAAAIRLPALKRLAITGDHDCHLAKPTVVHLAALHSPSLTWISFDMAIIPEKTFKLGGLPALASCHLDWDFGKGHASVMHVTPESLCGAPNLKELTFTGREVQLAPRCFSNLSTFEYLGLADCDLTAVPPALATLGSPLLKLHIVNNPGLQISPTCFASLTALAELALCGCELSVVPPALAGVRRTLRRLSLSNNPNLVLSPGCLSGFGMLTEISLRGCGLVAVPEALASVGRTLRRLYLINPELQIDQDGFDTLLALPALMELDLQDWQMSHRWTTRSVDYLNSFLVEWQGRHPGSPLPALHFTAR